jgi:hypothetical protein
MTQQDDPSKRHKAYSVHWYTPAALLKDLIHILTAWPKGAPWGDPCTSQAALDYQAREGVPAPAWHLTADALTTPWPELALFINPPFGKGMGAWVERAATHSGPVILLTPSSTEVGWWQAAARSASCVVFVRGRVSFVDAEGVTQGQNPKGTTLFLFGGSAPDAADLCNGICKQVFKAWARREGHLYQDLGGAA